MDIKDFIDIIKKTEQNYPSLEFGQEKRIFTCLNCTSYFFARNQPNLFCQFDGIFVDGILMCKALKYVWNTNVRRRSFDMTSIAKELFESLNDKSSEESVYFIGSKQNEVSSSVKNFIDNFPNMKVKGFRNGYFQNERERQDVIASIIRLAPTYVIVGLGKPEQEIFALDLKNSGYQGTVFTCGGFLHQSCNKLKYYPDWVNKYNLRWLYRATKEGIWMRVFKNIFIFPPLFIYDRFKFSIKTL